MDQIFSKFLKNRENMPKRCIHILWTLKKRMTVSQETTCGQYCWNKQSEVCVCFNGIKIKPFNVSVGLRQGCALSPPLFIMYMDKIDRDSSSNSGVTYESVIPTIKSLNKQSEVCVCFNSMIIKPFNVSVGLRQGYVLSPPLFIIYMDKIDRDSSSNSGVTYGECNVWRLLFADDLALMSSNKSDLALHRFSDLCLDAGMKISLAKTGMMCLSRHPILCSFQINGVTLKQTKKFKYLGVTFSNDGRQDNELDTRIGKQKQ